MHSMVGNLSGKLNTAFCKDTGWVAKCIQTSPPPPPTIFNALPAFQSVRVNDQCSVEKNVSYYFRKQKYCYPFTLQNI